MPILIATDTTLTLDDLTEAVLGRQRDNAIPIASEKASRRNARVFCATGVWWVEDLHSANGTRLNGTALVTGPVRLAEGDVIEIGGCDVRFHQHDPASGPPAPVDPLLYVGRAIAGHALEEHLHPAVTGHVYRARHLARDRRMQFKLMDPRLVRGEETFAHRFVNAVSTAANASDAGMCRIYQCAEAGEQLWYTYEVVGGENLAHRLQTPIAPAEAVAIARRLARALTGYHAYGLIYGDVQPRSIHLDGEAVRFADIGLAGLSDAECRLVQAGGLTRQVFYLCPVQAETGSRNVRGDLYGLGCILFHMLAGRPPFLGGSYAAVLDQHLRVPVPAIAEPLHLPAIADRILGDMLAKDPFHRLDDCASAERELAALAAALG